jgi:alkylation response protein AidB-like acyl-CoA dehydrogenase
MQLDLTDDQEFFRDTTARFLTDQVPPAELRRLRDDPTGFAPEYWRRGAELGWTSLLVSEAAGGGSISGTGLADLALVAYEFGHHAAPGPLVPTNVVAAALSDALSSDTVSSGTASGQAGFAEVLDGLLAGTSVASWAFGEPRPHDRLGSVATQIRIEGDEVVVDGTKRPVESARQCDHLLVTGRTGDGLTQVLVPARHPGVAMTAMASVDLTRRFDEVSFDSVRLPVSALVGEPGHADAQVEHQLQVALVLVDAESVGAMQIALDTTIEWAFDRYSFGRPLASYQELKHRFADMKTWLEASHAISDASAAAVAAGTDDAASLVSAAKAFIGDYGSELMHDCVQIHGGIGVTYEHDLHLYLRRHTMDRALYGVPADHRQRIAELAQRATVAA